MIRVTLRRFFSTIPVQAKINQVDTLAKDNVSKQIVESMHIQENIIRQGRIKQFERYHQSVALNFAEMENGKRAILRANYENIRLWGLNFHNVASLAFLALTPLMPSIFYAAGALSYFGYAFYHNIPNFLMTQMPRIEAIDLLENGQLSITLPKDEVIIVERSDFKYGVGNNSIWKNKNIWCEVEGRKYVIGGKLQINQQLFHEIA